MDLIKNALLLILYGLFPAVSLAQLQGLEKLMSPGWTAPEVAQYNPGLSTFFEIPEIQAPYMNGIAQHLIKNRNGLYVLPDGTGRVYKVERTGSELKIVRQDSTSFFGYNFGFFPFNYRDTLFSFGGYGYWRFNGHLRTFVPQKGEWELENLNREIPFTRVGYTATPKWIDQKNGKFWIAGFMASHEGLLRAETEMKRVLDSVYALDIQSKQWALKGILNSTVKEMSSTLENRNLGSSPWGQLIHDSGNSIIYLLDFPNNQLLKLNMSDTRTITQLFEQTSILFFKDSTLFIGVQSRSLDSIQLSKSKFIRTNQQVYQPIGNVQSISSTHVIPWIVFSISVIGLSAFLYLRKKNKFPHDQSPPPSALTSSPVKLFEDWEMDIIRLVASKSSKGFGISIEELNRSLGVHHKSQEVQKKHRSEALIAINRKWRFKNGNQEILIKKRRIETDKRSFEYYIDFKDLESIAM